MSDHPPPGWVPPSADPLPAGEQPPPPPGQPGDQGQRPGPYGSPYGAPPGSAQGSPPGSAQGSPPGSAQGSPPGSGPGSPYGSPYGAPWATPVHKPGVVALRPLKLGDFFDGAFKTIRRNPKAMVGLAALVSTAAIIIPVLLTLLLAANGDLTFDLDSAGENGALGLGSGAVSAVTYLGSLFGVLGSVVLNGMLVRVVANAVLGQQTSIGEAWASVRGRLLRLFGLTLLSTLVAVLLIGVPVVVGVLVGVSSGAIAGFAVGVPLVLLGLAALLFVGVRCFLLAAPALVLERIGVVASLRRATALSRQQFWRLLGITLLTQLVVGLASQVVAIPLGIVGALSGVFIEGTAGALVLVFSSYLSQIVVGAITTPFTSGVVALQYVDQRIRKEGLDVSLIAAAQQPPGTRG